MTIRYQPDGGRAIYAKAYFDGDFGCLVYRWQRYLWENGFGVRSKEQVPEPLGYVARESMLLMRAVSGIPVSDLMLAGSLGQAKRLMRLSALWLAKFHKLPVPGLQAESPCERMEILKTADLLAKVAAACPERTSLLIDLVHQWKDVAFVTNSSPKLVSLHGQFRPAHVFVQREAVVAIDLDKLTLSDPAKDVARFAHSMTKACMELGGDLSRVTALVKEFISAYDMHAPGNLANLRYYMALYSLKQLGKVWKNKKPDDANRAALSRMHLAGFQKWVQSKSCFASAA
jgi:aminoglycoside phosphotransferase (APT) family kinase protein